MRPNHLLIPLVLGLAAATAHAEDRPWWKFWGDVAQSAGNAAADAAVRETISLTFTPEQRAVLRDFLRDRPYYSERHAGYDDDDRDHDRPRKEKPLPPGLRKKLERGGDLPPGWQKKLARGEVVDDTVWRASRRLPPDVLERLGALPRDTEMRYVEDKVYRVIRNTREIVDILSQ